jgi:hypothetical protein
MGEINKGAIALIVVLLFGAGGYLWYSMMYTPAVAEKTTALAAQQQAQSTLQAAQSKLAAAQQEVEESKKEAGKPDTAVAEVQVARKAVPNERLIDDAAIVLMDIADRSGIRTSFSASSDPQASTANAAPGPQGSIPIDLTFTAAGSYDEMMLFMRLVEGTVVRKDGKLYASDRLFNVVRLELSARSEEDAANNPGSISSFGDEADPTELVARPGEMIFTVVVRMYSSTTKDAQNVGASTPDPAAGATAGTDPATGQPAAGATGTTGAPAGGATGTPATGSTGTTGTPSSTTGTPSSTSGTTGSTPAPSTTGTAPAGGVAS